MSAGVGGHWTGAPGSTHRPGGERAAALSTWGHLLGSASVKGRHWHPHVDEEHRRGASAGLRPHDVVPLGVQLSTPWRASRPPVHTAAAAATATHPTCSLPGSWTQGSFPALPPRRSAVMNTVTRSLQEGSAARVLQHGHGAHLVRVLHQNKPFPNKDLAAADHEVQPPGGSLAQLVPGNLRRSGAAGSRILGWRALLLEVRCSEAHRPNIEDEIFPHSRHHEIHPCYTTPHCIYTTRHCINTTSYHTTAHHTVLHCIQTVQCFPSFPKHIHIRNSHTVPLFLYQDSKYMNNSVRSLFQAQ